MNAPAPKRPAPLLISKPGFPAPAPKRIAPPPVYRPQQSHAILPKFYQGPKLPVAGPPPVYRPGGIAAARPALSLPVARVLQPRIVQRASLLEQHRAARDAYTGALPAAYALYNRGVTAVEAARIVTAHPPDDAHFPEAAAAYVDRVRQYLIAEGFNDRGREWTAITDALRDYRAALVEAARQAALQQQRSQEILDGYAAAARDHAQQVIRNVIDHVFTAEVRAAAPSGLHAYTDGVLPANVNVLLTIGNVNQVHILVWTAAGAAGRCKWSSMFPQYMPQGMVCWYILNHRDGAHYRVGDRAAVPPWAWAVIAVGQSGDTNYPDYPGGEAAARTAISVAGGANYRTANANGAQRRYLTSGGVEYTFTN